MSAAEIVKELEGLPLSERKHVAKRLLHNLCRDDKVVERLMRRIENPDLSEDGRLVDMETALREQPPGRE